MTRKLLFVVALATMLVSNMEAQTSQNKLNKHNTDIVNKYTTALSNLKYDVARKTKLNSELNPYYLSAFNSGTYLSRATNQVFSLSTDQVEKVQSDEMRAREQKDSLANVRLFNLYVKSPSSFQSYEDHFMKENIVESEEPKENDKELNTIISSAEEVVDVKNVLGDVNVEVAVTKPNFWKRSGNFSLQFTQNYFSENWYKGGNNSQSILASLVLEANYNNQNRLQWDNKLEMRLGFITTNTDTCHTYITNNDKIYARSKLGYKAAKAWYYTFSCEAQTQFMPSYRTNNRKTFGNFLAPLDVFASVGMDFKPQGKNGNSFSLALLPFSYKMRFINSDDENIHAVFNMVDLDYRHDLGSKVEANARVNIAKNLTWNSRFYFFTSYEYTEGEFENKFDFKFSRYISAQVFTIWRFDDNRPRKYYDDNLGYFQFKEYVTFGLSYAF